MEPREKLRRTGRDYEEIGRVAKVYRPTLRWADKPPRNAVDDKGKIVYVEPEIKPRLGSMHSSTAIAPLEPVVAADDAGYPGVAIGCLKRRAAELFSLGLYDA